MSQPVLESVDLDDDPLADPLASPKEALPAPEKEAAAAAFDPKPAPAKPAPAKAAPAKPADPTDPPKDASPEPNLFEEDLAPAPPKPNEDEEEPLGFGVPDTRPRKGSKNKGLFSGIRNVFSACSPARPEGAAGAPNSPNMDEKQQDEKEEKPDVLDSPLPVPPVMDPKAKENFQCWYKASISDATTDVHEKVTYYRVFVESPEGHFETFDLHKRFSDFVKLNNALKKQFRNRCLPTLPSKTMSKKITDEFVAKRRRGLETYMEGLCEHLCVHSSPPCLEFFSLDKERGKVDPEAHQWKIVQIASLSKTTGMLSLSKWLVKGFAALNHYTQEVYAATFTLKNRNITKKRGEDSIRGHISVWLQRKFSEDQDFLWKEDLTSKCTALAQHPKSYAVYFGAGTGNIQKLIFDDKGTRPDKRAQVPTTHEKEVTCLLFLSEKYLLAGSSDKTISLYDTSNDDQSKGKISVSHPVVVMRHDRKKKRLFIGTSSSRVLEYDTTQTLEAGELPKFSTEYLGAKGSVLAIALAPTGHMWTGGSENTIYHWNRNEKELCELTKSTANMGKGSRITGLAFCGDIACVATGTDDGNVALLHLPSDQWIKTFRPHKSEISVLTWRRAAVGQSKRRLHLSLDTAGLDGSVRSYQMHKPKYKRKAANAQNSKAAANRNRQATLTVAKDTEETEDDNKPDGGPVVVDKPSANVTL